MMEVILVWELEQPADCLMHSYYYVSRPCVIHVHLHKLYLQRMKRGEKDGKKIVCLNREHDPIESA